MKRYKIHLEATLKTRVIQEEVFTEKQLAQTVDILSSLGKPGYTFSEDFISEAFKNKIIEDFITDPNITVSDITVKTTELPLSKNRKKSLSNQPKHKTIGEYH